MSAPNKLYTAEELHALLERNEHADRRLELIHGEIVEKMPTLLHGWIVMLIGTRIMLYLQASPIGWVITEGRHSLPGDPHNSRIPDLSFVSHATGDLIEQGAAPFMPDFAIEVQSPDQDERQLREKATYYLEHGTRLVWLVLVDVRKVLVIDSEQERLYAEGEMLSGHEVLPGFEMPVSDIFKRQA